MIEQLRGRFDAYLKAAPENLLREQTRLLETQTFLTNYQTVYATEASVAALQALRQKVSTHKRPYPQERVVIVRDATIL